MLGKNLIYCISFCTITFKSIRTIKPIRIKNKPKYERKESSNELNLRYQYISLLNTIIKSMVKVYFIKHHLLLIVFNKLII